jgi:hypothetical protein
MLKDEATNSMMREGDHSAQQEVTLKLITFTLPKVSKWICYLYHAFPELD